MPCKLGQVNEKIYRFLTMRSHVLINIFLGLLVVGGSGPSGGNSNGENWETSKTVELWAPGTSSGSDGVQCRLPDLPDPMSHPSLDSMLVGYGGGHWETIACYIPLQYTGNKFLKGVRLHQSRILEGGRPSSCCLVRLERSQPWSRFLRIWRRNKYQFELMAR